MPWKFQRWQMGSAGECTGNPQTGFVYQMMFWIRCQCLEISSFYIKIGVSHSLVQISLNAGLKCHGFSSQRQPLDGSCLLGLKALGLWTPALSVGGLSHKHSHETVTVERTRLPLVLPVSCMRVICSSGNLYLQTSFNHSHPGHSPMPSGGIIKCDMNC